MTTGKARSSQLFLKQLAEFMKYCEARPSQDLDGALRSLGFDPDEIAAQGRALTDRLFNERLEAERTEIKKARVAAQAAAATWTLDVDFKSEPDIDKAIAEIVAGKHGQTAQSAVLAFNHNFQRPTVKDKLSLLKDLGFLKMQAARNTTEKK